MNLDMILETGKHIINIAKDLAAHANIQFNHLTLEHFIGVATLAFNHHKEKKAEDKAEKAKAPPKPININADKVEVNTKEKN